MNTPTGAIALKRAVWEGPLTTPPQVGFREILLHDPTQFGRWFSGQTVLTVKRCSSRLRRPSIGACWPFQPPFWADSPCGGQLLVMVDDPETRDAEYNKHPCNAVEWT